MLRGARTMASRGDELRHEGPWGAAVAVGASDLAAEGRWVVATVGTLENLRQLRTELGGEECPPQTPAEIVAHLIGRVGVERALPRIEGAVAVVAWDGETLWAARDRTGARRLYVRPGAPHLVATDASALAGDAPPPPQSLQKFVINGWLDAPDGWSSDARAVAPGTLLRCSGAEVTELRWFTPGMPPAGSGGNRDRWRAAVENAVRLAALRAFDGGAVLADGGGAASTLLGAQIPDAPRLALDAVRWDADVFASVARDLPMTTPAGDPRVVVWAHLARIAADRGAPGLVTGLGATDLFGVRHAGLRPARVAQDGPEEIRFPDERDLRTDDARVALRAAAPAGPDRAVDAWVRRCSVLPEYDLLALDIGAAASGGLGHAPFAGALVSEVVAQVPYGLIAPTLLGTPLLTKISGVPGPHRPLTLPIGPWTRASALFDNGLVDALDGWMDPDHVRALVSAHQSGAADHGLRLWRTWALARWRSAR